MLTYLFNYLEQLDFPGAGLFQYISFRAAMALITSLIVSIIFGKRLINLLRRQQIGETVRDLGLAGQLEKAGTPTMGGIIILSAILIPTLLFAKLHNVYVFTMLLATVWLGVIVVVISRVTIHLEGIVSETTSLECWCVTNDSPACNW